MICSHCGVTIVGAPDPSPAELRALNVVCDFHDEQGRFPTYREIGARLGISWQAVAGTVHRLAKKGWVRLSGQHGKTGIIAARRAA